MAVPVQSDGLNIALSPVAYGDIVLSINTQYNTFFIYLCVILTIKAFKLSVYILTNCHVILLLSQRNKKKASLLFVGYLMPHRYQLGF